MGVNLCIWQYLQIVYFHSAKIFDIAVQCTIVIFKDRLQIVKFNWKYCYMYQTPLAKTVFFSKQNRGVDEIQLSVS